MNSDLEIKTIDRGQTALLGIVGEGAAGNTSEWIAKIWEIANSRFNEISHLAKLGKNGEFTGFWGAMSDIDETFLPWNWQGKYMAGIEVNEDIEAPQGWTKWILPAFRYLSVKCNQENYRDVLDYMLNDYIPNHRYNLVGATQEYYNPSYNDDSLDLLFPIEVL